MVIAKVTYHNSTKAAQSGKCRVHGAVQQLLSIFLICVKAAGFITWKFSKGNKVCGPHLSPDTCLVHLDPLTWKT